MKPTYPSLTTDYKKYLTSPKGIDQPSYQTGNVAKKNLLETILFVITLLVVGTNSDSKTKIRGSL